MKKALYILGGCLIAVAACLVIQLSADEGKVIEIISNGRLIQKVRLNETSEKQLFTVVYAGHRNIVAAEQGAVYMQEADCQDQVCVRRGRLDRLGPVVCLPNKLVIRYEQTGG